MTDSDLPSMGDLQAARSSQQARTISLDDIIELKKQARQIALEILVQASTAATSSIAPLPDAIVDDISAKLIDHALGFIRRLSDDAAPG